MTTNNNMKIFARLRPPLQHEIYSAHTTPSKDVEKKGKTPPQSKSMSHSITYPKQSSLHQDFLYSFYAPDDENNQKLIYLKNPVKGKLLEKNLKDESGFETVHDILPEVSAVFEYDKVFGPSIGNNKVYQNTCKKLVIDALSGKHSTILTMGPANYSGGKNYLLRGEETKDKGLVLYFLEDILDLSEISRQSGSYTATLKCSIYGVYQNNVIDFLAPNLRDTLGGSETEIPEEGGRPELTEERISTTGDFKHLYRKSMNNLKLCANEYRNNEFKNDCHIIISLIVEKQLPDAYNPFRTYVNFVRLASTDDLIERKFVREDLKILLRHLLYCASAFQNDDPNAAISYQRSKLTQCLHHTLNETTNIALITCVSPAPKSSEGSIYAVEFCYAIRQEVIGNSRGGGLRRSRSGTQKSSKKEVIPDRFSKSFQKTSTNESMLGQAQHHRARSIGQEDFHTLYDLYNKTKSTLKTHETSFSKTDDKFYVKKMGTTESDEDDDYAVLETDIKNIKKEIYHKIDQAIEESLEHNFDQGEHGLERIEEAALTNRNLRTLKKSLQEKERLEVEAMEVLKKKEKKAKERLLAFRNKIVDLETNLQEKDRMIKNLEGALHDQKKEVKRSQEQMANMMTKEELLQKNEDDLKEIVMKLKHKYAERKKKHKERIHAIQEENNKLHERAMYLERVIEEHKIIENQEEKNLRMLHDDLKKFKEEYEKQEKVINVMKENTSIQDQMIDDLKAKVRELAQDNERLLMDRSQQGFDKNRKIKDQILRLEERNAELERENLHLRRDKEKSKHMNDDEITRVYKHLEDIKRELQITRTNNEEQQRRSGLEMARREREIQELQAEMRLLQKELVMEKRKAQDLADENANLIEQNQHKLKILDKYERQLDNLGSEQVLQMNKLEAKCQELVSETNEVKQENIALREKEKDLLRRLDQLENSREELFIRCNEYKKENRALKENIKEIDDKMRKLLVQNTIDLQHLHHSNSGSKIRRHQEYSDFQDF